MSASEMIQPNQGTGTTAEIAEHRAKTVVLHNSRIVCWTMYIVAICSVFLGVCMVLLAFSVLIPLKAISFMRILSAAQWGLGGLLMAYMCPALWRWTDAIAAKRIKMDERGVDFCLGTKKKPVKLFMPWADIVAVKQEPSGNVLKFTIQGTDGSYAQFSSYTFFRSKRVARMIAERAGLTMQKA